MKKHFMRSITAAILTTATALTLISGCSGKEYVEIPELIEPAAINESYRPVEYGNIGKIFLLNATVVPVEYCQCFSSNVVVSSLAVQVGDYVNEGDVVAYADIENATKQLESLKTSLAELQENYALDSEILALKIKQLQLSKTEDNSLSIDTQIATLQENARYDAVLHSRRVESMQKSISEYESVIASGTLVANHSGQVTYTKNLKRNSNASATENIVVIADTEDKYLELDVTVKAYKYKNFDVKYTMLSGIRYDVTELDYSAEELILSKSYGGYPKQRLTFDGVDQLSLGDTVPIYYIGMSVENVLIIGNDSIYSGDGDFVYVLGSDGTKERRNVTLGRTDGLYTQVLDGLSEGEQVYYNSNSMMPSNYNEQTIELTDFVIENHSVSYEMSDSYTYTMNSEYEGKIVSVNGVMVYGREVTEGELLYVIDVGSGKAALVEKEYQVKNAQKSYDDTVKNYTEQIAELKASELDEYGLIQLRILENQNAKAIAAAKEYLDTVTEEYEKMKANNDGSGLVSVYSEYDGKITQYRVEEGLSVAKGDMMLAITTSGGNMLRVDMKADASPSPAYQVTNDIGDVGEKVTVDTGSEGVFTGTVVGYACSGAKNDPYVYTDEDGVHYTYNVDSGFGEPSFFVKMDDESFYDNLLVTKMAFNYISLTDVVVLADTLISKEVIKGKEYNYVWRIVDGNMVKQYVLVSEDLKYSNNSVILSGLKAGDVIAVSK